MELPLVTAFAALFERVAPAMLDAAMRGAIFLGVAGVAVTLLRRSSAATRHWVWLMGVAGVLALPGVMGVMPGWNILPGGADSEIAAVPAVQVDRVLLAAVPVIEPAATVAQGDAGAGLAKAAVVEVERAGAGVATEPAASARAAVPAAVSVEASAPVPAAVNVAAAADEKMVTSEPSATLPWTFWVMSIWIAGSVVVMGQVALGYLSLSILQRRCLRVIGGEWVALLAEARKVIGVRRRVELLSSARRTMPMTWGLRRTRVLLPAEAGGWTVDRRKAVLLHELGHVRRGDCVAQMVAQMACAMYWFNPLVWVAWSRMQVERERACDDLVLNTGARASAYAEHLLHSASAMPVLRFVGAAVAMARPSTLEERLRAILDTRRNRRGMGVRGMAMGLMLVGVLVPVAVLRGQEVAAETAVAAAPTTPVAAPAPTPDTVAPVDPAAAGDVAARMRARRDAQIQADAAAAGTPAATARPPTTVPAYFGGGRGGFGRGGFGGGAGPVVLGDGPTCALDATIYDVRLPVDKIGQLDVETLTKASSTAAEFEKALAALGTMQPLYRANQSVRLAGDNIMIGTQTPYVTNSQVNSRGQNINTVQYAQTGAIFNIAGKAGAAGGIEMDLSIQISALSEGAAITNTVKATVMRQATIAHKGQVVAKQPFVILSVDAASVDANGKAVAYIARVTLGVPSSPAAIELSTELLKNGQVKMTEVPAASLETFLQDLTRRRDYDSAANGGKPGPDGPYLSGWIQNVMTELERRGYTREAEGNLRRPGNGAIIKLR